MSETNEAIAENIIRNEARMFAVTMMGDEYNYQIARTALKERLVKELDLAEGRGANP